MLRFALALLLLPLPLAAQEPLRVGFGSADVTPILGKKPVYLAGFGKNRQATKIHDPIMARAVVLAHKDQKIAIVSVDVVGLFHDLVEDLRPRLPGISYLLVTSTHNHEGPDTLGIWGPNLFQSGVDPDYMKKVADGIVAAAQQAIQSLRDVAETRIGAVRDANLVHDSRLPIVKHDELVAIEFLDAKKSTIGVIVQWNCHPEDLGSKNTEVSADFVASTVRYLEKKRQAPVVYLTGTVGGLLAPNRVVVKDEAGNLLKNGSFERTERYGQLIGQLAEKALQGSRPAKLTPFTIQRRNVYLPIDNSGYLLGFRLGVINRRGYVWSGDSTKAEPLGKDDKKARMACKTEIARLRLGELDVAAIPGEIYPELVLGKVQNPPDPGSDFPNAAVEPSIYEPLDAPFRMIVGLANDEIGYILPKRQWDVKAPFCYDLKKTQYGEINSLGPETGPLLCSAFRAMARDLKRD